MSAEDTTAEAHYQTRCQFLELGRIATKILLFFVAGMTDISLRDACFSFIPIAYWLHQDQLFSLLFLLSFSNSEKMGFSFIFD